MQLSIPEPDVETPFAKRRRVKGREERPGWYSEEENWDQHGGLWASFSFYLTGGGGALEVCAAASAGAEVAKAMAGALHEWQAGGIDEARERADSTRPGGRRGC